MHDESNPGDKVFEHLIREDKYDKCGGTLIRTVKVTVSFTLEAKPYQKWQTRDDVEGLMSDQQYDDMGQSMSQSFFDVYSLEKVTGEVVFCQSCGKKFAGES